METWNRAVFLALNAPERASDMTVKLAMALAQDAIFLVPVLLATLWLWGRAQDRAGLLVTFVGAEIALGFNQIAALLWYHPRPFAVPIGRTLVEHAPDSSFPSDHVTFLVATGLGLVLWTGHRFAALAILALAIPVAWARLYLGIHFPLDMVGALPVAGLGVASVYPFRTWASGILMPRWVEPLYRAIFVLPIRKGWIRA